MKAKPERWPCRAQVFLPASAWKRESWATAEVSPKPPPRAGVASWVAHPGPRAPGCPAAELGTLPGAGPAQSWGPRWAWQRRGRGDPGWVSRTLCPQGAWRGAGHGSCLRSPDVGPVAQQGGPSPRPVGSACEHSAGEWPSGRQVPWGRGGGPSVSLNHTPAHAAFPPAAGLGETRRQGISPAGDVPRCCSRVRNAHGQVVWVGRWPGPCRGRGAQRCRVPSATATPSGRGTR